MNYEKELEQIWSDYLKRDLSANVKRVIERGYVACQNYNQKDILITGINPSFRKGAKSEKSFYSFELELMNEKWDRYWGPLKKILFNKENVVIDYRDKSAYVDLFSFREQDQNFIKTEILKSDGGIVFIAKQLALTQIAIEEIIKPKVIIIKNKESAAYWGKYTNEGLIWLGYDFEKIENCNAGEIYRINGFVNSSERINSNLKESNLKNSIVLFSHHINQYTKKEKRPTPETISRLFELYK
jgi:hypothetical protein